MHYGFLVRLCLYNKLQCQARLLMLALRMLAGSRQQAGCISCGLWGLTSCSRGRLYTPRQGTAPTQGFASRHPPSSFRILLWDTALGCVDISKWFCYLLSCFGGDIKHDRQTSSIQWPIVCQTLIWPTQSHSPVHLYCVTKSQLKGHKCTSYPRATSILHLQHTVKIWLYAFVQIQ